MDQIHHAIFVDLYKRLSDYKTLSTSLKNKGSTLRKSSSTDIIAPGCKVMIVTQ